MIFKEEFYLDYKVEDAWQFFTDFPSPILVLPGVQKVEEKAPLHYVGAVQVKIGLFSFLFKGDMQVTSVDEASRQVVLKGSAHDYNLGGTFEATAFTQTLAAGPNRSRVALEVHVGLGGAMGKVGMWLLKPKAHSIVLHYADLVSRELERRQRAALSKAAL